MKKAPRKTGADENLMYLSLYFETVKSQGRGMEFVPPTLHIVDSALKKGLARLK